MSNNTSLYIYNIVNLKKHIKHMKFKSYNNIFEKYIIKSCIIDLINIKEKLKQELIDAMYKKNKNVSFLDI